MTPAGRNPAEGRPADHSPRRAVPLRDTPPRSGLPPRSGRSGNRKASPEGLGRLSENLKRLRKARGYTQRALAEVCGVSQSYVGNVEQGTVNITLANLEALARGLACCATDLLRPPPPRPTVATASPPAPHHGEDS